MKLLRFHFTAPIHIGSHRAEYDRSESMLHSDSLYAAIQQAWAILGKPDWISDKPDFTLSSLFPFYRKEKGSAAVYFFPRPARGVEVKMEEPNLKKKANKVQFLEKTLFEELLKTGKLEITRKENLRDEFYLNDPDMLPGKGSFLKKCVNVRNHVPRFQETGASKDSLVFYYERIFFLENSGLFCLFEGSDTAFKRVRAALRFLEDEGLGTDRHIGNGQFELEIEEQFSFDLPKNTAYCLNLSLFCPSDRDTLKNMLPEDDKIIAFELAKRGGWVTNEPFLSFRKNSIFMFQEGSVFARPLKEQAKSGIFTEGATHDLRPKDSDLPEKGHTMHPVYRSGKSIFLPFNAKES